MNTTNISCKWLINCHKSATNTLVVELTLYKFTLHYITLHYITLISLFSSQVSDAGAVTKCSKCPSGKTISTDGTTCTDCMANCDTCAYNGGTLECSECSGSHSVNTAKTACMGKDPRTIYILRSPVHLFIPYRCIWRIQEHHLLIFESYTTHIQYHLERYYHFFAPI